MKTVKDYLDLGLAFVGGDKLISVSNDKDGKEVCMSGLCIAHKRYCEGFIGGNAIFFYPSEWTPSSFAWRNNDGVKPEYKGLIHAMFENGVIIQDFAKSLNWGSSFNPVIQWRPTVLKSGDVHENNDAYSTLPIGIDSPELRGAFKLFNEYMKSNPKFTIKEEHPSRTATVNIEGHDYLLVSHAPTVPPKEDKPMKPVYTAEMHAKGELPPVGAECILIANNEPRPAKVTYIGKDIVCCSNVDGDAEYACLLGLVSFKPIIKTIKVNGFDVPAPMSEAPEIDSKYFVIDLLDKELFSDIEWEGDCRDFQWLQNGIVHSTKSAAIAHAKAMLGIDPNA